MWSWRASTMSGWATLRTFGAGRPVRKAENQRVLSAARSRHAGWLPRRDTSSSWRSRTDILPPPWHVPESAEASLLHATDTFGSSG